MAITLDTSTLSSTTWPASAVASVTWSHTTSASATLMVVTVYSNVVGDNITSVTYNGVAMTLAVKQIISGSGDNSYIYYLANPTSGAHSVVINLSPSTRFVIGYAETLIGAGTTQPDSTNVLPVTGVITNPSQSTTVVAANSWLVAVFRGGSSPSATSGAVRQNAEAGTNTYMMDSNGTVASGSQTLSATNSSDTYNGVIASFSPPGAVANSGFFFAVDR